MPSLVVQTSFLGDMVLTTPLIAHLARSGPVDVLATKAGATLLANNAAVREIMVYDKRGTDRGVGGFHRIGSALRARRYQSAYMAQGSMRSGALALVAGIPERVGFASSAGRLFYTTRVPLLEGTHHAAKLLSLATRDPLTETTRAQIRPHLYPGIIERAQVDAVLGPAAAGMQLVALAPGSVWATKRWPYFAALAHELSRVAQIVVVGAVTDRELAEEIVGATKGQAIDATGRLALLASAELIGRSALLVTNDSAPLHLASAMNTPTLAVFGPTVPEFGFGPLAERATVAGNDALACRPCDRHGPRRCPLGHWRCMREITPDGVLRMAMELL
jgi:heptosyltransferase II